MFLIFVIECLIMLFSLKVYKNGQDSKYLSRNYTTVVKGIFVIIIFLSHVRTYAIYEHYTDLLVVRVLNYFGQLMVAPFLFYSGYGIVEAIKTKGEKYIDKMPANRIGKTFFDFSIAIFLFLIVDVCLRIKYSISDIILAFTGWTTVGNSNWYMFAIFTLYIITYLVFKISKGRMLFGLILLSLASLGYVYVMSLIKENWWSSTYLCYAAGCWYSYLRAYIEKFLFEKKYVYYLCTLGIIITYIYLFQFRYNRLMMFNIVAILFCVSLVLVSAKISFQSKILYWFGTNVFWVYILQRIPMRVLSKLGLNNHHPYVFLITCFLFTILLSIGVGKFSIKMKSKIWK